MQNPPAEQMTLADFLAWERRQPMRHELIAGGIVAMTGDLLELPAIGFSVRLGDLYAD